MRTSLWTDDINDPERDHLLLRLFPDIEALHCGWQDKTVDKLFEDGQKESDPAKRAEEYKRDPEDLHWTRRRSLPLSSRPIRWRCAKNVKGFVQIPLGNNIFAGAYIEK